MKTTCSVLIAILTAAAPHTARAGGYGLEGTWPAGGGPITITTTRDPIQAVGLDIKARGPYLSNSSSSAPWDFYITGNDRRGLSQVTLGSLGSAPTIDGTLTLDVTVDARARTDDVRATWGDGTVPRAFPLTCCPEPGGSTLAAIPLFFFLCLRQHRKA